MVNPRSNTGVFLFRMNINYNNLYLITKVLYICINNKTKSYEFRTAIRGTTNS